MTLYSYGIGHNLPLGSLTECSPQPRSGILLNADKVKSISRFTNPRGFNIAEWDFGYLTFEQFDTLMAGLGTLTIETLSAETTILTTKNTATSSVQDFIRANALTEIVGFERALGQRWLRIKFRHEILEELV